MTYKELDIDIEIKTEVEKNAAENKPLIVMAEGLSGRTYAIHNGETRVIRALSKSEVEAIRQNHELSFNGEAIKNKFTYYGG